VYQEGKSELGILLISGLLAILGTVAGGVIKGYWDTSLAETKFQSDLVMRSLESNDEQQRVASLRFMVETNLISDEGIRSGLMRYMTDHPGSLPQFRPSALALAPGTVVPRTAETAQFVDYDVFICDAAKARESAIQLAGVVVDGLKATGRIGRVRLRHWSLYDEIPLGELEDRVTIIVDRDHAEAGEIPRIKTALAAGVPDEQFQVIPNRGSLSEWFISIIVCPAR
jgi:hypothetical protein